MTKPEKTFRSNLAAKGLLNRPLPPGKASRSYRVQGDETALERWGRLTPEQRGRFIEDGFARLGPPRERRTREDRRSREERDADERRS